MCVCVWVFLFTYEFTMKAWPTMNLPWRWINWSIHLRAFFLSRNPTMWIGEILRMIAFYIFGLLFTDAVLQHLEVASNPNCCQLLKVYFGSVPWMQIFGRYLAMAGHVFCLQAGWLKDRKRNTRHKAIWCCWYMFCVFEIDSWFFIWMFHMQIIDVTFSGWQSPFISFPYFPITSMCTYFARWSKGLFGKHMKTVCIERFVPFCTSSKVMHRTNFVAWPSLSAWGVLAYITLMIHSSNNNIYGKEVGLLLAPLFVRYVSYAQK